MAQLLLVLVLAGLTSSASVVRAPEANAEPTGATYASGFDMTKSWGNLSPYKDAPDFGLPKGYPKKSQLKTLNILHRHAERYPTPYTLDGVGIDRFSQKLVNYSRAHPNVTVGTGPLSFLGEWENLMGSDLLLATGAATEASRGAEFWSRYGRLLYHAPAKIPAWDESLNVYPNGTARPKPVFRTTSESRILESARWWLSGFFGNIGANSSYSQYDLVVIPEDDPFNNTLAPYDSCSGPSSEG